MTDREIEARRQKAKARRYKKPIVNHLNLEYIKEHLEEMQEVCTEVQWFEDTAEEGLINELIGGEEEAFEFKIMFSTLANDCEQMINDLEQCWVPDCFDIFVVAAGGGDEYGGLMGYDALENDYFGLESWYETKWAMEEACKKMMAMTKKEMLEAMQQCFRIYASYIGLANRYEDLKESIDIIRSRNSGQLKIVDEINRIYEEAAERNFSGRKVESKELDQLLSALPRETWL